MPEDTQSQKHIPPPTPHVCPQCRDQGWWVDGEALQRGETFFFWCSCPTGVRVRFEDEGGD